jgi:hypothetical protein
MRGMLLANVSVCLVLVGLIWTIQIVHYPLFARVGAETWSAYHAEHTARITVLVGPLMVAELLLAFGLVAVAPDERRWVAWLAAALVGVAWLSTMLVSVPIHGRIASVPDAEGIAALVRTNWIRTVAWTLRAGLLVAWVARV